MEAQPSTTTTTMTPVPLIMEVQQSIDVKLLSNEIVKPSSPTPLNQQTFTLSYLDQTFPPVQMPILLVYANTTTTTTTNVVACLKASLADTLTTFYPLAGRCEDENTVSCKDQGTLFRETIVSCRLTDVFDRRDKFDLYAKFVPPVDIYSFGNKTISEFPPLSFQVNLFQCGGVVIGCWFFHKFLDASSLSCFLNYWAAMANNRCHSDLIAPNFESTVAAFPPTPLKMVGKEKSVKEGGNSGGDLSKLWRSLKSIKVVGNCFVFSRVVIKSLKAKAASATVPNPTGFQAVAGFIWQHIMAASKAKTDHSILSFSANIRARTSPILPKGSMGNLIVNIHAISEKCRDLSELVKEINAAILTVREKVETMQGEGGAKAFRDEREAGVRALANNDNVKEEMITTYTLTSWCKLGLNDVDFGFGKPSKIIPFGIIHPFLRNNMTFLDHSDLNGEDGIQVWLFLREEEMNVLESNQDFRAFAA